jgi:hypothetical protein
MQTRRTESFELQNMQALCEYMKCSDKFARDEDAGLDSSLF